MRELTTIENCRVKSGCDQRWRELTDQGKEDERYCSVCKENVHWCNSQEEVIEAKSKGWCELGLVSVKAGLQGLWFGLGYGSDHLVIEMRFCRDAICTVITTLYFIKPLNQQICAFYIQTRQLVGHHQDDNN